MVATTTTVIERPRSERILRLNAASKLAEQVSTDTGVSDGNRHTDEHLEAIPSVACQTWINTVANHPHRVFSNLQIEESNSIASPPKQERRFVRYSIWAATVLGCFIALLGLIFGIRSDTFQSWSAAKEFWEFCQAANATNLGCQDLVGKKLDAPPYGSERFFTGVTKRVKMVVSPEPMSSVTSTEVEVVLLVLLITSLSLNVVMFTYICRRKRCIEPAIEPGLQAMSRKESSGIKLSPEMLAPILDTYKSGISSGHQGAASGLPVDTQQAGGQGLRERGSNWWSREDDMRLLGFRAQGMDWASIAMYFPSRTANACRKRHERLMEKKQAENWDGSNLKNLFRDYYYETKHVAV